MIDGDEADRLTAAVAVIGRTGAKALEVGYLDETAEAKDARWYATVEFKGAKVSFDEQASPVDAAEGLAKKLLHGGTCKRCGEVIMLASSIDEQRPGVCNYRRVKNRWNPGCDPRLPIDPTIPSP